MALLLTEGFGFSTNASDYFTYGLVAGIAGGLTIPSIVVGGAPYGDNCMLCGNGYGAIGPAFNFSTPASTFFAGFRFNFMGKLDTLVTFRDPFGNAQCSIVLFTSGVITAYTGSQGAVLGTSVSTTLLPSVWQFIEVGVVVGASGSMTVKVDGRVVLTLTSVNTKASNAAGTVQAFTVCQTSNGPSGAVAHVYANDNTGPSPWNTFLGDVRVQSRPVISADAVAFTPPSLVANTTGSASASANNSASANTLYLQKVTAGTGGTLTSVGMVLAVSFTGHAQAAVYADNGLGTGPTGAPLATSAAQTNPSAGAITFAIASGPHLVSGTTYWIALLTDAIGSWRQNTTNPSSSAYSYSQTYGSGFPTGPTISGLSTGPFYQAINTAPSNLDVLQTSPPNPSAAFNSDATVNDQDTFNVAAVSTSATTVFGIAIKALIGKSDAGARSAATVMKSGGTTSLGSSTSLGMSPTVCVTLAQTDPNTSAQWTQSAANAIKVGYKVSA